jgi:hypothetical protein
LRALDWIRPTGLFATSQTAINGITEGLVSVSVRASWTHNPEDTCLTYNPRLIQERNQHSGIPKLWTWLRLKRRDTSFQELD